MRPSPLSGFSGKMAIALTFLIWTYFLFKVPTFDFDESLFRRVSESMKVSGDPWNLVWDERPLFHKPPLFYWLVVIASWLFDSGKQGISFFAARLPSVLATFGILASLYFGMKALLSDPKSRSENLAPVFAFLCALFPVLTSAAVIFDPLQTLALMPALLIPTRLFYQNRSLSKKSWLLIGLSLAAASCVKGLNGFVIPAFAFGVHLLFQMKSWGLKKTASTLFSFLLFSLIPGALVTALFFLLLHYKIGPGFTDEFFWVQHLGRSLSPMEAHSGGLLYHPFVIFMGSCFLSPVFIQLVFERRPDFKKMGYPLTFALSFILVFSFSATKLPHYTWPAWPALALFAGMISLLPKKNPKALPPFLRWVAVTPVLMLGLFLLTFGAAPDLILDRINQHPKMAAILYFVPPLGGPEKVLLVLASLFCFIFTIVFVRQKHELKHSLPFTALFSTSVALALLAGLTPTLKGALITPFYEIAADLKALHPARSDCLRYSGNFSATLSLALAPELNHNRCEPGEMKFLIAPEWKAEECSKRGFKKISQRSYLVLCGKPKE